MGLEPTIFAILLNTGKQRLTIRPRCPERLTCLRQAWLEKNRIQIRLYRRDVSPSLKPSAATLMSITV